MNTFLNSMFSPSSLTDGRTKETITHIRPLVYHPKVELILVPTRRLPLQRFDTFLFGMVISRSKHIVFMFLEDPELGSVGQLGSLLMVSSVERVSKGRHCEEKRSTSVGEVNKVHTSIRRSEKQVTSTKAGRKGGGNERRKEKLDQYYTPTVATDTRRLNANKRTGKRAISSSTLVRRSGHRPRAVQRALQIHPDQNTLEGSNRRWGVLKSPCGVPHMLKQNRHSVPSRLFILYQALRVMHLCDLSESGRLRWRRGHHLLRLRRGGRWSGGQLVYRLNRLSRQGCELCRGVVSE